MVARMAGSWRVAGEKRAGMCCLTSSRSFCWISGCVERRWRVQATPVAVVSWPAPRKVITWSRMVSKLSLSPDADVVFMLSRTMRAIMSLSFECVTVCFSLMISVALLRMMLREASMSRFIFAGRYLVSGMKAARPCKTRELMSKAKTSR